MINRRAIGKLLGVLGAVALLPFKARAKPKLAVRWVGGFTLVEEDYDLVLAEHWGGITWVPDSFAEMRPPLLTGYLEVDKSK